MSSIDLMNRSLVDCLVSRGAYETSEQTKQRSDLLEDLRRIIDQWVNDVMNVQQSSAAFVCTFGSVCLNVHRSDSDMDVLCIGPRHVTREMFFELFPHRLRRQSGIREVRVIEDAYVPVIKFEFNEINFDLVFARLDDHVCSLDLSDDHFFVEGSFVDPACARSVKGARLVREILSAVNDVEQYQIALRAVKLWARSNGIHSNAYGYFGGVTWALMLAFVAQTNPDLTASELLFEFFRLFYYWDWKVPIALKPTSLTTDVAPSIITAAAAADYPDERSSDNVVAAGIHGENNWMTVLTPTFPFQNTTYNTCESSKKIIEDELRVAFNISRKIQNGILEWDDLFEESSIVGGQYKHFLVVQLECVSEQSFKVWEGVVMSRIRVLAAILDENPMIERAQILDYSLPALRMMSSFGRVGCVWLVGLGLASNSAMTTRLNLSDEISLFIHTATYAMFGQEYPISGKIFCRHSTINELDQYIDPKALMCNRSQIAKWNAEQRFIQTVRETLNEIVDYVVRIEQSTTTAQSKNV